MALLDEIAQRAGVSRMTVSNVLNRRTKESTNAARKRAERIRRIATELNYAPNASAQALRGGRTHNIGLLFGYRVPELRGIYYAMLDSLTDALESAGYHLLFVSGRDRTTHSVLRSQRFDGCIVVDPTTDGLANVMVQLEIPGVLINVTSDSLAATVMPDDRGGVESAIHHLRGLGHQRIAYLKGGDLTNTHQSVTTRRSEFERITRESGIAAACPAFDIPVEQFVEQNRFGSGGITAVLCYSHCEAFALLRHLVRRGIRLPQDVSVIGFNDVDPSSIMNPSLTMVDVRPQELGRIGAELLLEQILDNHSPRHVMVPTQLVVRESTARAPLV